VIAALCSWGSCRPSCFISLWECSPTNIGYRVPAKKGCSKKLLSWIPSNGPQHCITLPLYRLRRLNPIFPKGKTHFSVGIRL
jgi:hypothetical protein